MRLSLLCCLIFLLVVPSVVVAHAEETIAPLKSTPCRFDKPLWEKVDCYDLMVPEDRSNPDSPNIRLHVAYFHSRNPQAAADPVVYLDGGPGFSPLVAVPYAFDYLFAPFLETNDLIIVDQRGTGYSQPNLRCPELDYEDSIPNVLSCWKRLEGEGIHMTSYTSAESAADFDALRQALGFEKWNLYGGSYGTRLALTIMRDYPEGLRSVVLDGVYPPQVSIYSEFPRNVDRAFQTLFTACATDAACNEAYPDLRNVFKKLVSSLDEEPAHVGVDFVHPDVPFTASDFISVLFGALYDDTAIPYLPSIIYEADYGNYEPLFHLLGTGLQDEDLSLSHGMFYAIECTEEAAFTTMQEWEAAAAEYPYLRPYLDANYVFGYPSLAICGQLDLDVFNPVENDAVISDVPTMILNGQFDPVTPQRWGKTAAMGLSHSYMFTYPGLGHVVFTSDRCPQAMVLNFLADPNQAPDSSCISFMPSINFVLP